MKREYHLRFSKMEKYILGEKVIETLDAAGKKTMLIYEVLAALITMLGVKEKSADETVSTIEAWIEETLYKKKSATTPAESAPPVMPQASGGNDDFSKFMGNSSFSDLIGGRS